MPSFAPRELTGIIDLTLLDKGFYRKRPLFRDFLIYKHSTFIRRYSESRIRTPLQCLYTDRYHSQGEFEMQRLINEKTGLNFAKGLVSCKIDRII